MNHHPPSPVGRALTVVLGVLPFTVITLLVFLDWPPLRRWDCPSPTEVAEYGAAHSNVGGLLAGARRGHPALDRAR